MRYCTMQGCDKKNHAKNMCGAHYRLAVKSGTIVPTKIVERAAIIEDDHARIPLGHGARHGYSLVDISDAWVDKYKWVLHSGRYVMATINGKTIQLHRLILGTPTELVTDHINGDRLDNRRSNLRVCTQAENAKNQKKRVGTKSLYKGVSPKDGKYQAAITHNYKKTYLGFFGLEVDAAKAYDKAAIKLHGKFAKANF